MNEVMSLLLVTSIIAVSGVGYFIYSSKNDEDKEINKVENYLENEEDVVEIKPRSKQDKSKTKRARKSSGTKRRF